MPSLSAAIFVYVNNAVNQSVKEILILIGRISKQESKHFLWLHTLWQNLLFI